MADTLGYTPLATAKSPAPSAAPVPYAATPQGIAKNTIAGIPQAAHDLVKHVALTVMPGLPALKKALTTGNWSDYSKFVSDKLPGKQQLIEKDTSGKPRINRPEFEKQAEFIGGFAGNGDVEGLAQHLAHENSAAKVAQTLVHTGLDSAVAEKIAPHIAGTSDAKEVTTMLHAARDMHTIKRASDLKPEAELSYHPTDEESVNIAGKAHAPQAPALDEAAVKEYNSLPATVPESDKAVAPTVSRRGATDPDQLRAMLRRTEQSLAAAERNPEAHAKAYGPKIPEYKAKIAELNTRLDQAEGRTPPAEVPATPMRSSKDIREEMTNIGIHRDILSDAMADHPGRELMKYRSTVTGGLPEVSAHARSKFGQKGDQIGIDVLGHDRTGGGDLDKLEGHLTDYMHLRQQKGEADVAYRQLRQEYHEARTSEIEQARAAKAAIPAKVRTPAVTINEITKGPAGPSWSSIVKGFSKNLPKQKKAHMLDYLGTPEFVLEKLGLQKGAEMLQDAKDLARTNKKIAINKIISWKSEVEADGKPHSATRIFRYLDGDARYAKSEMTPTEVRIAGEIKGYLHEWADRLHLPEDARLSNYITHLFDKDATDLPMEDRFSDPDLATIMESTPAKSVYNPFMEKRLNKPGYKEDVWAALDAYVKRATRKEAMDPALEHLEAEAHKIDATVYRYVTRLTHNINMRPDWLDEHLDIWAKEHFGNKFTDRPTAYVTRKIRNVFYRGLLGLNVSSALRNLSQGANTYAKLGERYTVTGYSKLAWKLATRNLQELYDHGILDEALDQDRKIGVYKTFLQKADPKLFALFDMAEKINRGAAYYGAKSQAIAQGLGEDQAIKYAARMVRETQFAFGAVDSPALLSGDALKTLAQLHTFDVKQTEFLGRMLKNKEYAGLIRWSLASLAFISTVGKLFHMTLDQVVPSLGIGGSPTLNAATAVGESISSNPKTRDQGHKDLARTAISTIPAGIQLQKSLQGLTAYNAGKDTTATGRTRYKIPHTTENLIRATLFGKNNLPQAQDYYAKMNNKTTTKKTVTPSL